jgi:alpha-tubulin suppressor-like RCC1 family protein
LLVAACQSGPADPGAVAARLGLVVEPPATTPSGAPLNPQPVVQVQDASGNPVALRGLLVTASVDAGGGSLVGQVSIRTDPTGRAAFTDLGIAGPVATRVLRFGAQGLASTTSRPVAIMPGTAAAAAIHGGNNQTAAAGTPVTAAPAVKVVDAYSNPVPGVAVSFTVASGGGSVTGANSSTGADGVAAAERWILGPVVGLNTLRADIAGLEPLTFTATGVVGPPALLTIVEGDGQAATIGAAVATAPAVRVADAFANPIAGLSITFVVASGGGTVAGATPLSDAAGIARLGQWRLGLDPGANTLTASRAGVPPVTFSATGVGFAVGGVAAGQLHTCAVAAGAAWCWGNNTSGELGTGALASDSMPLAVTGGLTFTQVVTGLAHSCGLTPAGAAWCWGLHSSGQLGDGTPPSPVPKTSPVAVSGGNTFTALAAGGLHTCGLRTDGALYCWGEGGSGQLGTGILLDAIAPVPVSGGLTFTSVTAGSVHTCAIATGGTAYCWGSNANGRLGDGTLTGKTIPTAVTGGGTFSGIAAGGAHTCAIDAGGAALCWGLGSSGQLGNGATAQQPAPVPVGGGLSFSQVSTGAAHTCGVTVAGTAHCWGANGSGRLGDGTTANRTTPVGVVGAITWSAIAAGGESTCARSSAGSALCWGRNAEGQLGDGSTAVRPLAAGVKKP